MFVPRIYSVESVTPGHPDKVCDQISDAILDACLQQDPLSRVAIESFGAHGHLVLGGEVTTNADVAYQEIARQVYRDIGYTDTLAITTHIVQQSREIAQGVDTGGAGDQGVMYGYACDETPELLPKGVVLAHQLARGLDALRRDVPIGPDGKTQVTMDGLRVTDIVVSTQHQPRLALEQLRRAVLTRLIHPILGDLDGVRVQINPAGAWHIGGFAADTGLTGRKLMVDTYGGCIPHGGGAFSGMAAHPAFAAIANAAWR
jgi:S-adenosylmethionine synthetase